MIKLYKCKFCKLTKNFKGEIVEHIQNAHPEELYEELIYDEVSKC